MVVKLRDEQLQEFINDTANLASPWGSREDETYQKLASYETRTKLEEAALVVGLLGQYRQQHQGNLAGHALRLRTMAEEKGLNLATAFAHNSYLKTYEIFALCLQVLKSAQSEDPDYIQRIETSLRTLLNRWKKLGIEASSEQSALISGEASPAQPTGLDNAVNSEGAPLPDKATAPSAELPSAAVVPQPQLPGDAAPVPVPLPGDTPAPSTGNEGVFTGDEAELRSIQALLDQGSYQEALSRLAQFKGDSPFYPAAQEKARNAKNLAVQDLRRKAATSFQNSLPVSDSKAKVVYLTEAQNYLEQALNLYPDAEQIETVKQNLQVIKKSLGQLKQ